MNDVPPPPREAILMTIREYDEYAIPRSQLIGLAKGKADEHRTANIRAELRDMESRGEIKDVEPAGDEPKFKVSGCYVP